MSLSIANAKKLLDENRVRDARGESDTIRLWEGYREQATLWRSLALLQIPATVLSVSAALLFWFNMQITLNVPPRPMPGVYSATELPKEMFIEAATNFVNLIATYQPATAQRQYLKAREMAFEPFLSQFDQAFLTAELKTIINTNRTQVYFIDPNGIEVTRNDGAVQVTFSGERMKYIASKLLPRQKTKITVTLSTIPNTELNPYGIVVTNLAIEDLQS